jgi:hypothetical protein
MQKKDWPTKEKDLEKAVDILESHVVINEGDPLSLLNIIFNDCNEEDVDVKVSDWVLDLSSYFISQYGSKHGKTIASKVLTKCLLLGETIH